MKDTVNSLVCIRCGTEYRVENYFRGCQHCLDHEGKPSSLTVSYKASNIKNIADIYEGFFPFTSNSILGEGNTPEVFSEVLSNRFGLNIRTKMEGQNPTGSHKDRMSAFIVKRAKETNFDTVAVASSGNAGMSLATYSAFCGLKCKVIIIKNIHPIWRHAIESTGAELILKNSSMERWDYLMDGTDKGLWFPATNFINPPVGSNPFGVQALKGISFEIIRDSVELPDHIIVPTSRGDLLWGIYEGFLQAFNNNLIHRIPKLIAVEPFSRISAVMAGRSYTSSFNGDSTETPSIGGTTVTYQAIKALRNSNGFAEVVPSSEAFNLQREVAEAGFFVEKSSSLVLGALKKLLEKNIIPPQSNVLLLFTSHGYK